MDAYEDVEREVAIRLAQANRIQLSLVQAVEWIDDGQDNDPNLMVAIGVHSALVAQIVNDTLDLARMAGLGSFRDLRDKYGLIDYVDVVDVVERGV